MLQHGHNVDYAVVRDNAHAQFGDFNTINTTNYYLDQHQSSDPYHVLVTSLTFDRMDERARNVTAALSTTSGWLPSHPHFTTWIDGARRHEHNGFLWLKGKPGSGKSTIMRETLERARQTWPDQIVLSYFFNARSPHLLEKSSLGLYRSLVWHLTKLLPTCLTIFVDQFRSKIRHKEIDGRKLTEIEVWKENELQNFLVTVVRDLSPPPITIFIDALDEGADGDVRVMVAFLEQWTDHATTAACPLHICLASRHYPHISVTKSLEVVLDQETGHSQDIQRYVSQQLVGCEQEWMSSIKQQICDRSAGIFLWVVLVVRMLNKAHDSGSGKADMLRKLKNVPSDLHAVFSQIFAQGPDDLDRCVALCRWVLFAGRPLSPVELYSAVQHSCRVSDAEDNDADEDEDEPSAITAAEATRYLLYCSRGLVEVTKTEWPVVQFIHETVRGYLTNVRSTERKGADSISPYFCVQDFEADICHQRFSEGCLSYLLQIFRQISSIEEIQSRFPLASYAAEHWWQHYKTSPSLYRQKASTLALNLLTGNQANLLFWVQLYNFDPVLLHRAEDLAPALYYAVLIGELELVAGVLATGAKVNAHGGLHNTPLAAASYGGHTQIVNLLLDWGADDYNTALYKASSAGHTWIVQMMLDRGADDYNGALRAVSSGDSVRIVQILLDQGANDYNEALCRASSRGHIQIVQMMLDRGAIDYNGALRTASFGGHTEIVQMMLKRGAVDYNGALLWASSEGHTQIVQMMLERGANEYDRAQQVASLRGHTQIVQMLQNRRSP